MNIIHAIFSFNVGGAETMLVDIINQQCKEASVSLIIVNNKVNADLLNTIDERIKVYLINRKEGKKIQLPFAFFKINRIVRKINPDVIHCHDNNLFPFFVNWRKKSCLTVHNVRLSTSFLKYYGKVFAISTAVQNDVKDRTGILAPIVYNGIETGKYMQRSTYKFDRENEPFKIALLSRLFSEQKGQHIALKAISILKEHSLNIKLYLIGGGDSDELTRLKKIAAEYNIENHAEFLGEVDRQWIKDNLKNYHLLIQPSLYEGFGITIIEGFACGLPVITSDLDGPKEICRLLNAGLLIPANDPEDLAEKIYLIYKSYIADNLNYYNYILKDKNQLKIFDIQTTVKTYINNYNFTRNENPTCQ